MYLNDFSDFETVLNKAKLYYGENVKLLQSTWKTKKYMIFDPYVVTPRWWGAHTDN